MTFVEMLSKEKKQSADDCQTAINDRNYSSYNFKLTGGLTNTLTDEQHKANIRKGIEHCLRGDVFQIVLSRRFVQPFEEMILKSTAHCEASIRPLICSTWILRVQNLRLISRRRISGIDGHPYIDPTGNTCKRLWQFQDRQRLAEQLLKDQKKMQNTQCW